MLSSPGKFPYSLNFNFKSCASINKFSTGFLLFLFHENLSSLSSPFGDRDFKVWLVNSEFGRIMLRSSLIDSKLIRSTFRELSSNSSLTELKLTLALAFFRFTPLVVTKSISLS